MLYSVEQRDERRALLKTPAWEANAPDEWPNSYVCVTVGPSDISKFTEGSLRTAYVSLRSSLPPMQAFLGELVFHPSPQTPAQPETTFLSYCFICVVSDQSTVVQ